MSWHQEALFSCVSTSTNVGQIVQFPNAIACGWSWVCWSSLYSELFLSAIWGLPLRSKGVILFAAYAFGGKPFELPWDCLLMVYYNNNIINNHTGLRILSMMHHLTNRFHVAMGLFSNNRSQMTSKCGKNQKGDIRGAAECVTDAPHFDILCDLLLNRCTATWNLFVSYNR